MDMLRQEEYRAHVEGPEEHDPVPLADLKTGVKRPTTLREEFQAFLRQHVAQEQYEAAMEHFDDEDNFEIGDEDGDLDWSSVHEMKEMETDDEYGEGFESGREPFDGEGMPDVEHSDESERGELDDGAGS